MSRAVDRPLRGQPPEGFELYARERGPRLLRLAFLLTGNRDLAEELVQETFTSLLTHWSKVQAADDREAYVYRVLSNQRSATFRLRRRREQVEQLTDALPETSAPASYRIDDRAPLAVALARLPKGQRMVVLLRYWEDRSETEVAALLDMAPGTVKSQASRGLAKLRELLPEGAGQ